MVLGQFGNLKKMIRLYFLLFILLFVGSTIGAGYYYYTDTQEKIGVLTESNAKLKVGIEQAEAGKKKLLDDIKKLNQKLQEINQEFAQIRQQNNILAKKLQKFDLALLGEKKPTMVQKVINSASKKVGRCMEILSGSPYTNKEKESKNGKEFNSECPWLWPGNTANPK